MTGFTARLELPRFIPKEQILGKHVYDSQVAHVGITNDWNYSSDGHVGIIVKIKNGKKTSTAFIPFSQIDRVGEFILLKTDGAKLQIDIKEAEEPKKTELEKNRKREKPKKTNSKYADEIDFEKLETILLKKTT
ncbi:MAG: hypothetical protein NWF14_00225 [Candidatus Bathyarchaeota archaeon]|nr:hypothetical protein [Candidatus Bathyarchaeota archaeon]